MPSILSDINMFLWITDITIHSKWHKSLQGEVLLHPIVLSSYCSILMIFLIIVLWFIYKLSYSELNQFLKKWRLCSLFLAETTPWEFPSESFQLQMGFLFHFLRYKDLRTSLLNMRTSIFLTLLYVGGTYARLV